MYRLLKNLCLGVLVCLIILLIFYTNLGGYGSKETKTTSHVVGPMFFAHRGLAQHFPENSHIALEEALKLGINAVEIDVRNTADNQLIVFHDEYCDRLLGLSSKVESLTLHEIQRRPLLYLKKPSQSKVMTLEEAFDAFHQQFTYYIDIKIKGSFVADELAKIIMERKLENSVIIAHSNIFFIGYLEYFYPQLRTALEGFNARDEWTYKMIPKNIKPDYYSSFLKNVDHEHMEWINENDLLTSRIVYGVDSCNLNTAMSFGLQHIIVDYDTLNVSMRKICDP
ncbi:MAG: glycerophosphodiester phosphodiesterase family protein [Saprospiraceae bacterium]